MESLKKSLNEAPTLFHNIMKSSVMTISPVCGANAKKINTKEFECVNGHKFTENERGQA